MLTRLSFGLGALLLIGVGCSSSPSTTSDVDGGTNPNPDGGGNPTPDGGGNPTGPITPCTVVSKGTSGTVLQGRVLAPAGALDGEVMIDSAGLIACVDKSCSATANYAQATVISCKGSVISPGLINAHDHTTYATQAPIPSTKQRWTHRHGWRTGAGGEPALPQPKSTTNADLIASAELRYVLGGGTALLSSGGVSGLVRNVAAFKNPEQLEGLTGKTSFFDTFPLGDSNGTELSSGCGYPSIRTAGAAFADGTYAPHVAEGINAAAENELTCIKDTLITNRTALIHGVGLNVNDISLIKQKGAMLIWSPRSNVDLYGNTASVTVFQELGVPIAMGTDWLPSGSMNMLRELDCASSLNDKYFHHAFTSQDLWTMATKNGAIASGFADQIGQLVPKQQADIAVFDGRSGADYDAVIHAGVEDVHLVLRGGKVLYGDATLTAALGTGCADLDVCGQKRQACVDTPGSTLASIQSAVASIYPLFFCKDAAPTGEPTCVPYRDTYPDGTSATDRDGDAIPDTTDLCPDVFDPIRPMDNGAELDTDKDGTGDVCDKAPLDPATH